MEVAAPNEPEALPGALAKDALPTLEAFISASRAHAPAMTEATSIVEQREAERDRAILDLLPRLVATASYTRNAEESAIELPTGTIVTAPLDQLDAALRLEATLVDVPAFHRVGASGGAIEAATLSGKVTQVDVEREVLRAYWDRLAADEVIRSADVSVLASEQNLRIVGVRRASELASDLDVARAAASVARSRQSRAEAARDRALASRKLRSLTGLDASGVAPAIVLELEPPPARSEGTLTVPSVLFARKNVEIAETDVTTSWLGLVPRVTASATGRVTNAVGFGSSPTYAVSLNAEWTLSASPFAAAHAEGARVRALEATAQRAASDAADAAEDAYLEIESRVEASRAARAEESATRDAAKVARELYLANKATQLEVTTAERDVLAAEVSRIRADAALELARGLYVLAVRGGEP